MHVFDYVSGNKCKVYLARDTQVYHISTVLSDTLEVQGTNHIPLPLMYKNKLNKSIFEKLPRGAFLKLILLINVIKIKNVRLIF